MMEWNLINKLVAFRDIDGSDINDDFTSLISFTHDRYLEQQQIVENTCADNDTEEIKRLLNKVDSLIEVLSFLCHLEREIAKINQKAKKYKFYFNLNNGGNSFGIKPIDTNVTYRSRYIKAATVIRLHLGDIKIQLPFNIHTIEFTNGNFIKEQPILDVFKRIVTSYKSATMKVTNKCQLHTLNLDLENGLIAEPAYDRIYID